MDEVYEILIHKVNDFGGTVNELTGDGIMALFGSPIALEDAPQRAIRSGLAIHSEITRFSERMTREKGITPLRMRVGIHSGPVVVGTVGNDLRVDFKAIGDTVNLASRMESLAEPGTIWVTEDTFKLTEGLFRFEALGEKEVKGKDKPVKVYRVIAPSSRRTRFDVSAERGLTPFVGRERELELLLDGFGRARDGMGQVYSIVGEAGVGKSRFLYEFRKAVSNENVTLLEGKCLSYGKATPYHPIVDILKANFEISEDDDDAEIRDKVTQGIRALAADETSTLPYLLELLSVKDSGIDKIAMSPEGRKIKIIDALIRIVIKGSEIRPLILVIEDLHWMDKSSEEAIKWLLEAIPGAKVMLVFTYRPEYSQPWESRSFHNQINLNRLSNRESLVMVSPLLGTGNIDPGLQKLIVTKTEGVPFFIEEFVKSLQDLKAIRKEDGRVYLEGDLQSNAVPSTIQDMIMARVDRLPDAAKSVLQAGSVIEREFTHQLIGKVTGLPDQELLAHLSALKDAELLYERGIYPQTSYIFRHALTREVVYNSILAQRRKELHQQIAGAIEAFHKDNLFDHYEILSEHFFQSGEYLKASEYYKRSARKAEKRASMPDAVSQAQKWVFCLEKSPESREPGKALVDARTALGLYFAQLNHPVEAMEAVEPVAQLAREKGYRKRLGQIETIRGAYYHLVDEDLQKAITTYEEALHIASTENDFITSVLANYWIGCIQGWDCNFEKARESIQKALDINIMVNNLWGIATMKANLAYFYCFLHGEIDLLTKLSSEALMIAKESSDGMSKGQSHASYGVSCFARGDFVDAERHLLDGRNLCERMGLFSWAAACSYHLAETYLEMKEFKNSKECFRKGNIFSEQVKIFPSLVRWGQLGMVRCGLALGERDIDLRVLPTIAEEHRIKVYKGGVYDTIREIFLSLGDEHLAEAEHWIRKAVEANERNGVRFYLGLNHALYADFFRRKGDRTNAQENLGKAIEILGKCGADGWVEKYERELATIQ
jgi:tetratricopeptide (TPR) repeat protein